MVQQKNYNLPDFSFEKSLWNKNFKIVAGVDEVGRGAFSGPVVAGCVAFAHSDLTTYSFTDIVINDSKKLKPRQREKASLWIKKNVLCWGIGSASVSQINKFGIKKATEIAFRKAIIDCETKIDFLLIDAFYIPYVKGLKRKNQKPIIHGDARSMSIAAASIIAKVHRDKLMRTLSKNPKYQEYGWGRNKGYGTKKHQDAIKKHGPTRLHRVSFLLKLS